MAYIKSHSNYVLRKKHQLINDGTVWERDMSTVGGIDSFVNGETPTYQSGNFVITRNASRGGSIQAKPSKWQKNKDGGDSEIWTLSNVSALTSPSKIEDDTKIVIKKDYFDLRDFAYYGSLSELFRSSLNDIAQRFPGELYSYSADVYYTEWETVNGENIPTSKKLGPSRNACLLSNPFGIDLHTEMLPQGADVDKYFAKDGYKGYSIIDSRGAETSITAWTPNTILECHKKGECFATVKINSYTVSAYTGDDDIVYYFVKSSVRGIHIRPSSDRLAKFYDECNDFERVILDPNTTPKYKATFSVIKENEFGYYRELEDFVFPTLEGDYNLDISSYGYNRYTSRLAEIGEYYDEYFSDNLYRSMTHESIKNFDWTFSRYEDENEEVIKGADRIKKVIRLYGREFDEVKSYIDAMGSLNRITYDDRANIPDYFLTDSLEDDGWDVRKVCPYSSDTAKTWSNLITSTTNEFYQDYNQTITPYSKDYASDGLSSGYFVVCSCDTRAALTSIQGYTSGRSIKAVNANGDSSTIDCKNDAYVERIRSHFNEREVSMFEVDNEFLRRLKINSRAILRHKGTIEGIEMMLGMFGLKSKQYSPNDYDYYIEEYYMHTNGIEHSAATYLGGGEGERDFEAINKTKLINYPRGGESNELIGLPMIHYRNGSEDKYYPYYNEDETYDGGVYYQMGGGWISNVLSGDGGTYNFQFDVDDNVVYNDIYHVDDCGDVCRLYKETIRTVRKVGTLDELLSIPRATLEQYLKWNPYFCGIVYYVENVIDKVAVIGGKVYPVYGEIVGNNTYYYVKLVKQDGFVQVGENRFFDEVITVYERSGNTQTHIYLRDKEDGYVIKAYANDNRISIDGSDLSGEIIDLSQSSGATNYFILKDTAYSTTLVVGGSDKGWIRLKDSDNDYRRINTIYNYVKGNNPHGSSFGYDMGKSYLEYLSKPFKYALDNDLFDDRCYRDYQGLVVFLNGLSMKFNKKNGNEVSMDDVSDYTCTLLNGKADGYKIVDVNEENDYISVSNVNTKRVKIGFKMHNGMNGNGFACELKYLDDIVSNYLLQMLPSTAIVEVVYEC